MSPRHLGGLAVVLLLSAGAQPAAAQRDTTIAGQTYALVPAGTVAEALRRADGRAGLTYRNVAIAGPLSATLAGLDTVRAAVAFSDVCFLGEVLFERTVFLGPVRFERTIFAGGFSFLGASFRQDLILTAGRCRKHANGKQAAFSGRVDFAGTQFEQTASFIGARFGGAQTTFAHAGFQEGAYFEQASFAGPTSFQDVQFEGLFSAKEAEWASDASFAGARFRERTYFWQARFAGAARFDAAMVQGETAFNQAVFSGPAQFRQVQFLRPAHFQGVSFLGPASFAGSRFQGTADFFGAQFAGSAGLGALYADVLDLRQSTAAVQDLRPPEDPRAGAVDSLFTGGARLYLQGGAFDRILVHWRHLAGRLAAPAPDSADAEALVPVYAGLQQQLRGRGLRREADACRAESLDRRRRLLSWAAPERWGLLLLDATSRYGTDPRRVGLSCLIVVLACAGLYRVLGLTEGERQLTTAGCAYYSALAFLAGPPFHPPGRLRLLVVGEAVVGWLSLGLFIATAVATLGW
jgi:hypothetical protein